MPSQRCWATPSDTGNVTGGQGVAGSNPAVPTGSRIVSNVFMPYREPAKEPISLRNDLLRPCADRVPRCPTRAFATTAELRCRLVKGSKIAEPLPKQPRSPGATRRLTAAQRWMTRSSKPGIRSWSSSCAGWSTSLQGCCVGRPPGWVGRGVRAALTVFSAASSRKSAADPSRSGAAGASRSCRCQGS